MTRSYKKHAIIKDHTGRWYNKIIRRTNKREVKDILKQGTKKAQAVAAQTLKEVKDAMNINYF